jgi:hypothetical protein
MVTKETPHGITKSFQKISVRIFPLAGEKLYCTTVLYIAKPNLSIRLLESNSVVTEERPILYPQAIIYHHDVLF